MIKKSILFFLFVVITINAQNFERWQIFSSANNILDVAVSEEGVWVAADGSAFMYNPADEQYTVLSKVEGLISQILTAVAVDNDKKIWFGSAEGYIMVYDPQDSSVRNILDIFKSDKTKKRINDIYIKGDTAFVATDFGLSLVNTKNFSFYDSFLKFGSFASDISVLSVFKSDRIYICTESGIAVQKVGAQNLNSPESWQNYNYNSTSLQATSVRKIISYKNNIIAATNNGIFSFNDSFWQPFILQGSNLNDVVAHNNNLLLTANNAVLEFSDNHVNEILRNNELIFRKIIIYNETPYIASSDGLVTFDNNGFTSLKPSSPPANLFINMSVDRNSNLWIATGKNNFGIGFIKYDGKTWDLFDRKNYPQIPSNDYYNVYAAADNTIYLSNWGWGATIFKDGEMKTYDRSNSPLVGIPINPNFVVISDIKTDSKGNIWFANHQSLNRHQLSVITKDQSNNEVWYHFSLTNPLLSENDVLNKMVIDQNDIKWFVVMMGREGLYYYNENGTLSNTSDDKQGQVSGLPSNTISSLAVDKRGQLWIGTGQGLALISNTSRPDLVTTNLVTAVRGRTINCIAVDPLDQKWIGTKDGVMVISPDGTRLLQHYNTSNSPIPYDDIISIAIDDLTGKVYIGTNYGLAMLQTFSVEPKESFEEIFVYPNPYVLNDGRNINLIIDGLVRNSSIKIFDISGKLINEFVSPGGKTASWNGKDLDGNFVPTGVYVIVGYDNEANNVATSKVAVIKK